MSVARDENEADGWRLDGRKFYCTGALFAHWVACVAVTPDQRRRHICFLPRDATPGLTLVDDWSGFGQKTTGSGTTIFADIAVPATHVFDHEKAFERPTRMGSFAQIMHAAIDVGIARGAFTIGLDHLRKHARPYGASGLDKVTDDPHMIAAVGDLKVRMTAADAMLERAGEIRRPRRRRSERSQRGRSLDRRCRGQDRRQRRRHCCSAASSSR